MEGAVLVGVAAMLSATAYADPIDQIASGGQAPAFGMTEQFGVDGDHDASIVGDDAMVFTRATNGQDDLFFMERSCK